ncbi:hypothetical protein PMZ80_008684 [Knufia obscura]|uniref:Uncharacterized protein n=1 Tax=Knufia obscura TaxID=1635080 RepID=A0ABR0RGM5_9EURO|nr:hypothetical protein PMZ80_008684 [Knufia obscura]
MVGMFEGAKTNCKYPPGTGWIFPDAKKGLHLTLEKFMPIIQPNLMILIQDKLFINE